MDDVEEKGLPITLAEEAEEKAPKSGGSMDLLGGILTKDVADDLIQKTSFAVKTEKSIQELSSQVSEVNAQLAATAEHIAKLGTFFDRLVSNAKNGGNGQVPPGEAEGAQEAQSESGGGLGGIMQNALPFLQVLSTMGKQAAPPQAQDDLAGTVNTISSIFQVFTSMQQQNTKAAVENLKMLRNLSTEVLPSTAVSRMPPREEPTSLPIPDPDQEPSSPPKSNKIYIKKKDIHGGHF